MLHSLQFPLLFFWGSHYLIEGSRRITSSNLLPKSKVLQVKICETFWYKEEAIQSVVLTSARLNLV